MNRPGIPFHLPRWLKDWQRGKQPSKEQIHKLRHFSGPTLEEMADLLHVAKRTYQDWEKGRTPMHPSHWLAMRIACAHYAAAREQRRREIREAELAEL